jgi:serine protease DegQ
MRNILPVALMLIVTRAVADPAGEDVFENAKRWTVQIRTAVDRAFVEDRQGSSSGAGMVVDARRGWVLTNAHVASRSFSEISVTFRGARPLPAERVYVDPYLDLAVVAYNPEVLASPPPEPALECANTPPVGHPVGAFGHPWGFRFTGTRGIASAITSRLGPAMLQTDAPINHGNSGGPLISLETGRVVGINAAIIRKDRAEGLSFAVPMPYACTILGLLQKGLDPSPPADLVDFAVDEDGEQTLLVARSRLADGAIDLRAGDVVVAVGSPAQQVASQTDLVDALRGSLNDVTLRVERDGREQLLRGPWPAAVRITDRQAVWISGALFADSEVLTTGHVAGTPGLMIHHVEPGSPAELGDLAVMDLLVSADGEPVNSLPTLRRAAEQAAADGRRLRLLLLRLASANMEKLFVYQSRLLEPSDIESVGSPAAMVRTSHAVGTD